MSTDNARRSEQMGDNSEVEPTNNDQATGELNGAIDELLNQLTTKFSTVTDEILKKMDLMSERLDNLEAALQGGRGEDS